MKNLNYQKIKYKLKYLLIIFIPIIIIGILVLFTITSKKNGNKLKRIKAIEIIEVQKIHNILLSDILSVKSDLMYLSQNFQFNKYLDGQIKDLKGIEQDFLLFSKNKKTYGQIRYIDESGMETIRINYNKGDPYIVKKENLQDKSNRYYFKDTIILDEKNFFLSKFDLNIENGSIEFPYNPTLRFATPVFDSKGRKKGIVIINYFGKELLDNINKKLQIQEDALPFLIDNNSYYLKSTEKNKEWGFMLEGRQDINFKNDSPEIWKQIEKNSFGSFYQNKILYTYSKVYPNKNNNKNYYWVIFTKANVSKYEHDNSCVFFQMVLFLIIIALLLSIIYSNSKYSEYEYSKELFYNSTMDKLTGIYNRNYLMALFKKEFTKSLMNEIDLICLIIDLDHFKNINNTYGHLTGDYVLKTVSQLIKEEVRNEDIFGRYGGDKFLLILPCSSLDDGNKVAEKLKNKIRNNQFKNKEINFNVTFSVGIAKLDHSMKNIDNLIEKADISLYKSKINNKN